MDAIRQQIQAVFADSVGLPPHELYDAPLSLADVVARSPRLANSVDLMEAFARVAHAVRRDHGIRVRLPAYPLDISLEKVLDTFMDEVEKARSAIAADAR
jgi:hypothetical protein